jgi:biotin carboxylase
MMREAWQKATLSQANFIIADSAKEIAAAAEKIGYPLIIKPTMNWGSRGTSAVFSPNDLQWSIDFAAQHQRSGKFIIEEYIDGTEMTIEGLIQNGKVQILAKSDKILQDHARFRVDLILHYPAQMPKNILEQVDQLTIKAAQALGLDNCAIHAEVMVRNQEIYLIEMAARPGGGHIFGQIAEAASGVSMPQALTNILLGEDVDIRPQHQQGAIYRFFTPPEGVFISVEGLEKAQQIQGVLDIGFEMASGTLVEPFTSGADRPGYCVTTAETREEAIAISEKAIATLHYTMESL